MSKKEDESKAYKGWYSNPIYKMGKKKNSYWSSWSKWNFDDDYGAYDDGWGSLYTSVGVPRTNKDKNKKICEDALRAVSRSANVILNSGENERRLSVKFSDGSNSNTVKDNVIYISPDKLVSAEDKDKRNDIVDSFCGQVMLSSQIKRQVQPSVYDSFKKQEDHDVCSLWSAIELAVARSSVIEDWSGFKPYFDAYAALSTEASATAIKKMLNTFDGSREDRPTNASAFIKGLAWNLYMSHAPVKIPSVYDKGKALVAEGLSKVSTSEDRWKFCNDVVKELRLMFDPAPPPPVPEESEIPTGNFFPDDELMGLLEPVVTKTDDSKEDKRKKKGADKFSGIDRELFGLDPISNKKCSVAKTIDAVTGDKSSEAKDTLSAPDVPNIDGECAVNAKPVWLPPDKTDKLEDRARKWSAGKLKIMDSCAERLKDSFNFRTSDVVRKVYGHKDGTLHDGSLYKVPMGIDGLFFKKSKSESDKVAVCLLIDQSGSMSNSSSESGTPRIHEAAQVAYVLAKLCKSVKNINLSIIGFSAQENSKAAKVKGLAANDELDLRLIYDDEDSGTSLDSILDMRAHSNNTDGFAVWYTAQHLSSAKAGYKRKVMIVVSDGAPNANNYGGESAHTHVNLCRIDAKRRFGVETYAIGVDNAYSKRVGDKMYGAGNNIIISDVKSSLGYISRFLSQVTEGSQLA